MLPTNEKSPDPVLTRIHPRWSASRTERNLAAALDRIAHRRKLRRMGSIVTLAASATLVAGAAIAVVGVPGLVARRPLPPVVAKALSLVRTPEIAVKATSTASEPGAPARVTLASNDEVALQPAGSAAELEVTPAASRPFAIKIARLRSRFRAHAERREYAAAYRSLVAAPGVVGHSPEDLLLAADAARLSGHAAESVPYFQRLLREHPSDVRAPVAAFTLGRILLSQLARPTEAADAFALARRLAPSGTLAADALAREVEAAARAGDQARAKRLAHEFASRYPSGRRAASVRRLGGLE